MSVFTKSKVLCATTVLLLGVAAINVQPITSTFATTKNLHDRIIPVRQILADTKALNIDSVVPDWIPQVRNGDCWRAKLP